MVIQRAIKEPTKFMDMWSNLNRPFLTVLNRGLTTNIIKSLLEGIVYKDSVNLGNNKQEAVAYLVKNPQLAQQIDLESKQLAPRISDYATSEQRNSTSIEAIFSEKDKKAPIEFMTNIDMAREAKRTEQLNDKTELLNQQLEEKLAEMKKMMEGMKKNNGEEENFDKEEKISKISLEDESIPNLQKTAYDLGWVPAMSCEDKKQLIGNIKRLQKGKK